MLTSWHQMILDEASSQESFLPRWRIESEAWADFPAGEHERAWWGGKQTHIIVLSSGELFCLFMIFIFYLIYVSTNFSKHIRYCCIGEAWLPSSLNQKIPTCWRHLMSIRQAGECGPEASEQWADMTKGVFRGFMKMCLAVDRLEEREWDEERERGQVRQIWARLEAQRPAVRLLK